MSTLFCLQWPVKFLRALTLGAICLSFLSFAEKKYDSIDPIEVERLWSSDPYQRLNLSRGATLNEIKKSYRKLVLRYHPDSARCLREHKDGELFRRVQEAFDILSDPKARGTYDSIREPFVGAPEEHPDYDRHEAKFETEPTFDPSAVTEIQEKAALVALREKYPALEKYINGVIRENLDPVIYKRNWRVIRPIEHLWPSDIDLAHIIIDEGTLWLKLHLVYCMLTLPLWTQHLELLDKILDQQDPRIARFSAEFLYFPHSINPTGARLLQKLLDQDHVIEVMRSLKLGGSEFTAHSPTPRNLLGDGKNQKSITNKRSAAKPRLRRWWDLPEGVRILKNIILYSIPRGDELKAILYRMDNGVHVPHIVEDLVRTYPEWLAALKLPYHDDYVDLVRIQETLIEMEKSESAKVESEVACERKSRNRTAKKKMKPRPAAMKAKRLK